MPRSTPNWNVDGPFLVVERGDRCATVDAVVSGGVKRAVAVALTADVVLVVVFCAIGRRSHGEAVLAGMLRTLWPFLSGLAIGWIVVAGRGRLRPFALWPTGVVVWLCTLVGGMVLRLLSDQGVRVSFVLVAATVLAVFLIGWRGAVQLRNG